MNLLLGFAPFFTFAVASHLSGPVVGLVAGMVVSAILAAREILRGKAPKILELGTLLLFGALCAYTLAARPQWTLMEVRLIVDIGLLLIVVGSLLIGKPFTIQYAREQVPPAQWDTPQFAAINRRITGIWAMAFVVIVVADLLLTFAPQVSPHFGIVLTILALVWAMKRTNRLSGGNGSAPAKTGAG